MKNKGIKLGIEEDGLKICRWHIGSERKGNMERRLEGERKQRRRPNEP